MSEENEEGRTPPPPFACRVTTLDGIEEAHAICLEQSSKYGYTIFKIGVVVRKYLIFGVHPEDDEAEAEAFFEGACEIFEAEILAEIGDEDTKEWMEEEE